jgi:pSer/pThr/pTyr-binding forkhead associated (FHA) protein
MGALDEELNIPKDAMLVLPGRTAAYCSIVCGGNGIDIDMACSIRQDSDPRCLIIGRQASSADIRIDHGSISRRHAAIYYKNAAGSDGTSANHYSLILQDLGGKHGIYVKGIKLEKRSIVEVNNGDKIVFGNMSEQVFLVQIPQDFTIFSAPSLHVDKTATQAKVTITREEGDENMGGFSVRTPEISKTTEEAGVGLSGRAKREAEIAAMMESLEDTPMYEKYVSADFEEEQESALKSSSPAFNRKAPGGTSIDPTISVSRELQLPVTKSAIVPAISSSSKPSQITAVALDLSGSRMVIGTTDTNLRFHDFNGMDTSFRPFKQVEVEEGHHIVDVCYSNTGDRILVGTGSAQPKVLDRDGSQM